MQNMSAPVENFVSALDAKRSGKRWKSPALSRDQIIEANPIVDFVRNRGHELKAAGENFVTSGCPVTRHKRGHRPVMIYPKTASFHCHDCKVGGSVIDWVMRERNLNAADAIQMLGERRNGSEPIAVYDYTDETGNLIYQVCRFEPKDFRQRRPDGNGGHVWNVNGVELVLYRLPEVIKANIVCVAEGEKDCDSLAKIGFTATCNVGGALKWRDEYSEMLREKNVVIFGDNDEAGREHVEQVIASLTGKGNSIKHVTLPDGFHDVSDYIDSLDPFEAAHAVVKLIEATPVLEVLPKAHVAENVGEEIDPIVRLAALPVLDYERVREAEAEKLQCRVSVLDKLVNAQRLLLRGDSDNLQGNAVVLPDIEPWPEAVNGAEILDAIAERFSHYVVLPDGAADVLALFCAHAHCYKLFQCSPRLNISSPEKSCGKTTLRDVVALFAPRPVLTENLTSAVLFRLVDAQSPVILADEYDSWITDNDELRGLLNAGHRKGAMVYRCEGDNNEVRGFAAYTPAVLCGIGALPGTLHDRSIVIRLERAKRGELQARFDSRHVELEQELCRKLARWCNDNLARLAAIDPKLPDSAFNRVADNLRPLFAVAEIAGGDWPRRCADAFMRLTSREYDADGLRVELLADIRQVFTAERMFSKDLIEQLAQLSERPWPEVCRGKPITERWLARKLAAFGIRSKTLRIGEERAKGYELSDFKETFERYLKPEEGDFIRDSVTYEGKRPFSIRDKTANVTDEKKTRTEGMSRCHACETPKPAKGMHEALI
jgi:5S rRNA maturation endonuclease (ribonuclease M5)